MRGLARAAVLAEWMTAWLGARVDVDIAASYGDLARAIERGAVDLAWAPPAVCARVHRAVRSVLQVVRYGAASCGAALVVRADSEILTLEDLAGKRASWVDPLSTSGHLMAIAHLKDNGLDAKRHFRSQRFAGSYRDALADVLARQADVTSVFVVAGGADATLRELRDLVGSGAEALALLCTTAHAPFDALVVPIGAPPTTDLEARILTLDQRMHPPAMLLEVCRADRFQRADPREYARFASLVEQSALDAHR